MEENSSPLLDRMVNHSPTPAPGRSGLKDRLQRLNISSVFDIAQLSETEFAKQMDKHTDDDTGQLHRMARSAAAQLETLFREQQVSPLNPASPGAKVANGVTYNALFKEDWPQFCASTAIAAVDSPVAYLRALYLFALQLEQNADRATVTTLAKRRPDLKDLLISPHSVSGQRPMLSIINQTLLDNLAGGDQNAAGHLLNATWYPFSLPYDFHHQQCLLGLAESKLSLGELNYRISRKLPVSGRDARAYGQVTGDHDDVQPLLTGLSPIQQTLLKQPLAGLTYGTQQTHAFFQDYYHWGRGHDPAGPLNIADFLQRTGLDAEQLQELLAQTTHKPRRSPYCKKAPDMAYGASYINGADNPAITQYSATPPRLQNVTLERFDRLQRMIRLQHWLDIPFAQLDTLLISSMRCEGDANLTREINHNTLRTLGVYRYLHKRYGLQPEEFAAVLHQLPVDASGEHMSLFDQVFNRADSALPPLYLDEEPFDATTRQQLCASLGVQDSPNSLQLLIGADKHPRRTIATISALYRKARIARLFGLSIIECEHLLNLLGHGGYRRHLLKPTLRAQPKGAPDVLDVLMHLDWANQWIKANGSSLALLRHQLLLAPINTDPAVGLLIKAFNDHPQPSLTNDLKRLVTQPADEQPRLPTIDWDDTLRRVSLRVRQGKSLDSALDEVLATLKISYQENRASMLISQARQALLPILETLKQDLGSLYLKLKQTLQNLPTLNNPAIHLKYEEGDQWLRLFAPMTLASSPLQTLGYLILLLPHAADWLQLPISRQALHQLLVNPHWLNDTYQKTSLLDLTLHNLFLMQQFKHCIDRYGVSEEQLLDYLKHANSVSDTHPSSSTEANSQLAHLLGWSTSEIEVLSQSLQSKRITSIERLDWVIRCRQASADTGLSAEQLLGVCRLNNQSTSSEWQAVGEAITSTHQ